jgi:hypothetical protein
MSDDECVERRISIGNGLVTDEWQFFMSLENAVKLRDFLSQAIESNGHQISVDVKKENGLAVDFGVTVEFWNAHRPAHFS